MYTLKEFLVSVLDMSKTNIVSEELYCSENNIKQTFLTNKMQETLAGFSYTLVRQGWLNLIYSGQELTLRRGDIYIYSPGFQVTIISGSDDYLSACLMSDERTTLESPAVRNMIRTAYYPIAELGTPVVHLNENQTEHFWNRMKEIIRYQNSKHRFIKETLRALYSLFLLDLMDIMEQNIGHHAISERSTELFMSFMNLLPKHFMSQHNIKFYASQLYISTTHLSRIVRQMTGRTVVDYINQLLIMEATWLLQSSKMSIAEIAERLHFADQSSFSKFFIRHKGITPKTYRMKQ